jgi:addiction module RelE/StbE family toxin
MAKVIVKYATKSLEDLDEIEEYYSDNPLSKQIQTIFDRIDDLKEQPFRGRPVPEMQDKNIRQIEAGNYRIIYHVIAEYLLMVLRVFHYKRHLNPDEDLDFDN